MQLSWKQHISCVGICSHEYNISRPHRRSESGFAHNHCMHSILVTLEPFFCTECRLHAQADGAVMLLQGLFLSCDLASWLAHRFDVQSLTFVTLTKFKAC